MMTLPALPKKIRRWPIDHVPKFDDVAINITFRCDLACVGCNRACFLKPPHTPDMSFEDVVEFLDQVDTAGVKLHRIRIIGGEQTLHPDYQRITAAVHDYAKPRGIRIRMFSNMHSARARYMVAWTRMIFPKIRISGAKKVTSTVFPPLTRYGYVSPEDAGIDCPHPCPIMGGRGKCGYGVDKLGYSLCPMAGTIDTLLNLRARATTIQQMLDPNFVQQQASRICSHCGNYIRYQTLPATWDHNGTLMSQSFHERVAQTACGKISGRAVP